MAAGAGEPDLPPHDDAFWEDLARSTWRRVRLRSSDATCTVFGTRIHRQGTYYVRPAYTDGNRWLSERGYAELQSRVGGASPPARRYGRRPPP